MTSEAETCPICHEERPLIQDHDHDNGLCRDRICSSCNHLLAHFDRPTAVLERFIGYRRKWEVKHRENGGEIYGKSKRLRILVT